RRQRYAWEARNGKNRRNTLPSGNPLCGGLASWPMSRLPYELFLALRYLRPKRTFVSIITLISVIGVMLGVAVLIVVIGVMAGMDLQLRDKLLGFNAHLRVFHQDERPLANYREVMQ